MTDRTNDETEARLRAALAGRAAAVEPADGGAVVVDRMVAAQAAARRRRAVLSAAAAVAVVAVLAGAFALLGGDDPDTDVATEGPTPTTAATSTTVPISDSTAPVIWPLPTMSVSYAEATDAAEAFGTAYLGITSECSRDLEPDDGIVLLIPSSESCGADGAPHPDSVFTTVAVERRAQGWVVTGADSSTLEVTPEAGAVVGADIEVTVVGPTADVVVTASVPPLGQDPAGSPSVDDVAIPRDADGTWRPILGAADGPTVLVVGWGITATAHVFTVDSVAIPPATTTTTTGPTDDGVPGWPGATSRHFDAPEAAASAFVEEVLGFGDPTMQRSAPVDDLDTEVVLTSSPGSAARTTVLVHDTGTARGWVVLGTTASNGAIDGAQVVPDPDPDPAGVQDVSVSGTASAFEATINVRVLDLEGNVLGETTTQAGANGEVGPFEATVHLDPPGNPFFVQVAEGDASGRGRFTWGAVRRLVG